jgi:hypothetical protein
MAAVCGWWLRRQRVAAVLVAAGFALGFFPLLLTCVVPRLDDFWQDDAAVPE